MTRQERCEHAARLRGLHPSELCESCQGLGCRSYSSTSTWRGGIGGHAVTIGQCDSCWGSGDKYQPWPNIRKLEQSQADWEEDQCLKYLGRRLGAPISRLSKRLGQLADLCDKQANKRKLPEGEQEFWWHHEWTVLSSILRKFVKDEEVKSNP